MNNSAISALRIVIENEIRNMFLIESGFIGLMGGIVGSVFSLAISFVVNRFIGGQALTGMEGNRRY